MNICICKDGPRSEESTSELPRRRRRGGKWWRVRARELAVQAWSKRRQLAFQNLATILAVLVSGILMWETSTDEFRQRVGDTIVFPLYLPHAVSTSMAAIFSFGVTPGNLVGLYLVRVYMKLRGTGHLTTIGGSVLFLVSFLSTIQSHVGAFYLHKSLCRGRGGKKYPTIDTVADAVWFIVIVTLTSMIFTTLIALCVTITPLAEWSSFWSFWSTWWLGILAALMTVTPLLVHLKAWDWSPNVKRPIRLLEAVITAGTTLAVMIVVFFSDFDSFRPMPYLCFPLITYAALRFNRLGWAVTATTAAFCCAWGSIRRKGALHAIVHRSVPWSTQLILQVQLFSIVMGVVSITLAAAVRETKSLTSRLHQMNRDLERTVECRTKQLVKTNEELQISQKQAEMASQSKTDFLANMSHEIRTPIHGILGLTALLLESELTVDQKESLVSTKECADLLLHIINSVLDLAKIEAGRLEVETVPFNIRKMVSSTFRMMQVRAKDRGLQLVWDVDRAVPTSLAGDSGKLQQCLLNLVGNALKFTHDGSISVHVTVASDDLVASRMSALHGSNVHSSRRMAVLEYESVSESMQIHFEVRDTGIGINRDKLKDMFQPFTQADASTSRLYGGTGLGLCIVHRFVELLGGAIWVESEVGEGSAFHFCLPLLLADSETPRPPGSTRPPLGPVISMDDLSVYLARKQQSILRKLGTIDDTPARRSSSSELLLREQELDSVSEVRRASSSEYEVYRRSRSDHRSDSPVVVVVEEEEDLPLVENEVAVLEQGTSKESVSVVGSLKRAESDVVTEMEGLLLEKKVQLRILLAEDNPINQKVASRLLQKHGHVVVIVGDGQQALELVCDQHDELDLVLMDVQMPIMDGLIATEQIRIIETEKGWSRIPILGLTAHAIQGYQDTCLTHGMDGYLGKPFDIQQLLKTIGHLLPGKSR